MKVKMQRTKNSELFKKGQVFEMEVEIEIERTNTISLVYTLTISLEGYEQKISTEYIWEFTTVVANFFIGEEVMEGWKFLGKVE